MVTIQLSFAGDAVGATSFIRAWQLAGSSVTRGSDCSSCSRDWALHCRGKKLTHWFVFPAALLVARNRRLARSALARADADFSSGTSTGSAQVEAGPRILQVGSSSRVGQAGRSQLAPGTQHASPVVPAGKFGLPQAPSSHRENYGDSSRRGPRFSNLPPPEDGAYNCLAGAAQPTLTSRLDPSADIRLANGVPFGASLPNTADNVCLVPEPYCRTIRPDQRVRAAAARQRQDDILPSLEKQHRLFTPKIDNPESQRYVRYFSDTQLRKRLQDHNLPVSGSRRELMDRFSADQRFQNMTRQDLVEYCSRIGMDVGPSQTKKVLISQLVHRGQGFWLSLPVEDLIFENQYRGIAVSRQMTQKALIQMATTARKTKAKRNGGNQDVDATHTPRQAG
eukprot:TRINITY_DN74411_c0_g1_i1.p1 TRINITY_DN74411_c0_g1~~TRINITY_DN74411_c0_g1_i1.p1  ORF type:complete len:394 (+),score=32.25 TRINITY_DN74411_c0_g1_i1:32-1213(+)